MDTIIEMTKEEIKDKIISYLLCMSYPPDINILTTIIASVEGVTRVAVIKSYEENIIEEKMQENCPIQGNL